MGSARQSRVGRSARASPARLDAYPAQLPAGADPRRRDWVGLIRTGSRDWVGLIRTGPRLLTQPAGGLSFRLDSWRDGYHAWPLGQMWPELEGEVDAAFAWDGRTYLIQGSQVSIFLSEQGHRRGLGDPRAVLAGDRIRLVDLTQMPRHVGEPVLLPHDHVDGAMCTNDGVFLFCGPSYHQYPSVAQLLGAQQPAPPQSIATHFFHCPQ
ncbi:PREDICTED: hemopexin [Aptenodytes forsteri]|uniref:hemopexin n=1 Tax=Aptenodytes forsteri TaxID=9233 RepID=UPI0004F4694D|nr:PREDICTED: hemopexin [Aptenodytes forsteri]